MFIYLILFLKYQMQKFKIPPSLQTFNDKMIISTSKDDKKILLWDDNTNTIVYNYEDEEMKTYIPTINNKNNRTKFIL